MAGECSKRCPTCHYEHYPHLHPAVIVLVRDGDRVLLARKAIWAPGRYALVAGFVDNGESLEAAVAREVREEVGVEVKDIRYVGRDEADHELARERPVLAADEIGRAHV